jgi:hypothetical protein
MSYDENKPWALHAVIIKKSVPKEDALQHAENIIKKKEFKARETKLTWRFRALPKTKFKKEKFRSKKVNKDITLVFGELLPEHAKLSGRGFFDFFKKGYESAKETLGNLVDTTTDYFKPRLDSYDNKTASMLTQIGNLPITRLQIYKAPLRETFNKALDLISLGAWSKSKKKYGFDTFYHLGLLATLDNGQTYIVEKLDRPSVSQDFNLNEEGLELLDVPLTGLGAKRLTINALLEDARKAVGDQKFFEYDSFRNNCQFFVRMLLDNQGLYTDREKNFFFQDISQLVNELPEYVQKFQRLATDTTATFGKITGQGVSFGEDFVMPYAPLRRPQGGGVEDFVKEKGMEVASDFADSLGGKDFFKGVQEDITDVFSGRQVGDTARQRTADREAKQKADQLEYEEKQREYRKTKEFQAETYARDIGGKFYEEIWPKWEKKFMTPTEGYLLYPEDVVNFGMAVRNKGLRSKAEVDKFFAKTKKDALQMLKTGKPVGDIKYDSEMLRKYQSQLKGSGQVAVDEMSGGALNRTRRTHYEDLGTRFARTHKATEERLVRLLQSQGETDAEAFEVAIKAFNRELLRLSQRPLPTPNRRMGKPPVRDENDALEEERRRFYDPHRQPLPEEMGPRPRPSPRADAPQPLQRPPLSFAELGNMYRAEYADQYVPYGSQEHLEQARARRIRQLMSEGFSEAQAKRQVSKMDLPEDDRKSGQGKSVGGVRGTPSRFAGYNHLGNNIYLDVETGDEISAGELLKRQGINPIVSMSPEYERLQDPAEFTKDLGKKMLSFYGIGSGQGKSGGMQPQPRRPASPLRLEQDMIRPANVIPEVSLVEVLERMQEQEPSLYEGVVDFICDDGCPIYEICEPQLDGDGKPFSRGYNFMRALNASKAPKNSQKASIVAWREKNAENAERINQSKFRKFDYSKLPKGSENNALRTKNPNPVGRHPVYEPTEFDIETGRNYGGLYALKKQEKKEEKKYLTIEDLDEDVEYVLSRNPSVDKKGEFSVGVDRGGTDFDYKGYIMLPEPKKGYDSIKTLGDFDVKSSSDGDYIQQLVLTRKKKKKEKKPKKAPQQNPEEKEEADFKEERPAPPPEPTIDELARGHYEADKELRKAIKKRAEERFGKAEFNKALVRVRKQMQRERDKEQGVERKFK